MSMRTGGLSLRDSPPILIPLSFFLTAPLALGVASGLMIHGGAETLTSRWAPLTLALTHLGTLGFLTMVMMGALYQMIAVVVGSPVPWLRLAHIVHVLFTAGTGFFCFGVAGANPGAVIIAILLLSAGILLFLIPVGVGLGRARSRDVTAIGMRVAMLCFFLTAAIGLVMARGFSGMPFLGSRILWSQVHLSVALLGWVGGLIVAVSWQVLPMFYLARRIPPAYGWTVQILAALGALLPCVVLIVDYTIAPGNPDFALDRWAAAAAMPAILAVWILHPSVCLWNLAGRKRKRADASLRFWRLGLWTAPTVATAAICAYLLPDPRWDLLFGWLALFGWAAAIMHGMLTRIVPFLVWLHRFAPLIGKTRVPSVKKILPEHLVNRGFALHIATLGLGIVAIASGADWLARMTGVSMGLVALSLLHLLTHVVRQRPVRDEQ